MEAPILAAGRTEAPYPPAGVAWRVIAVLFIVTIFSQLDRQLPALLVAPIRNEFGINDTAFSFLQGYAFALVYTLAGLPFGRLVDRTNRRNLIFAGVVVWSVTTALGAFAQSYWQLFASRMGVGIGEAVLAPAAYSMIADYVAPHRRARAMGVYYVSLSVGAAASLLLGGLVLHLLPAAGFASLPPWRLMFVLAGAPGLLLALLLLTVREPARRETSQAGATAPETIGAFLRHLRRHGGAFTSIVGYTTVIAVIGYGSLAWAPALYVRQFHMAPADAAMVTSLPVLFAGVAGTLCSAFLSDHWAARGVPAARLRVTVLGWLAAVVGAATWPVVPDATASLFLLGLTLFGTTFALAAAPPAIQDITPNGMRGQAIALYLLFSGLFGIGFGPTSVALVTDHVFHADAALPYSLVAVCAPLAVLGLAFSWFGLKSYAAARAAMVGAPVGIPTPVAEPETA